MTGKFKLKPTICGLPLHGLLDGGTARNILLNPARTAGNNSTPDDAANGWDWKDRLLISGITGLSGNQIIYLDGSNTPYIVSYAVSSPSAFNVRVIATLHQEYGVFGISVPNYSTVIFDQTISLADGSDASYTDTGGLDGEVEQSPSGADTLLNIIGTFGASGELKDGIRRLAGILKASISGTVNESGGGLSGSVSIFKTTAECSAPKSDPAVYDNSSTFHFKMDTSNTSVTTTGLIPFDGSTVGEGGVHNGVDTEIITANQTCAISEVSGAWNGQGATLSNGAANFSNFSNTVGGSVIDQTVIKKAYYDKAGQPHTLGFKYQLDSKTGLQYMPVINQSSLDITAQWAAFTSRLRGGEWVFVTGGRTELSGGGNSSITLDRDTYLSGDTYTIDAMLDDVSVATEAYSYSQIERRSITASWWGFVKEPLAGGTPKGTVQANMPIDGGDFVSVGAGGYVFLATGEAYAIGSTWSRVMTWDDISDSLITEYEVVERGVVTNYPSGSQPANKGFAMVAAKITDDRFVSLIYDNGDTTAASSAYGATAANHKQYIAYDPYTDAITESDTPIGYV